MKANASINVGAKLSQQATEEHWMQDGGFQELLPKNRRGSPVIPEHHSVPTFNHAGDANNAKLVQPRRPRTGEQSSFDRWLGGRGKPHVGRVSHNLGVRRQALIYHCSSSY